MPFMPRIITAVPAHARQEPSRTGARTPPFLAFLAILPVASVGWPGALCAPRYWCRVANGRPGMGKRNRCGGVTLLEMMFVVAIAATLVSLAAPSFASFRRAAGVSAATNELLG